VHGNENLLEVTLIGHFQNIKSSKLKFELLCITKLIKINFFPTLVFEFMYIVYGKLFHILSFFFKACAPTTIGLVLFINIVELNKN
jgi:hypothetical protein